MSPQSKAVIGWQEPAWRGSQPAPASLAMVSGRSATSLANVRRIALVGTYAPRKCGIATFSTDIVEQLGLYHPEIGIDVYVLVDPGQPLSYAGAAGLIDCDDRDSYLRAASQINDSGVDAVWLQHEYGIFGGEDGSMVSEFVDRLAAPLILTPHTVLASPGERQEEILRHLIERSSRIMVMSRHARDLLASKYGAPCELLEIIEHGAPDRPFGRQDEFKARLGLQSRSVLTTFGLLGPGKGLEHVIEALPAIAAQHPAVLYRIVGATHPNLVAREGEAYRDALKARAAKLGVADHIEWVDRFLDSDELLDQLEACDIYLTPYPGLEQSTSGTLSYAVALGKAVISTRYRHACELLEGGVGCLIEPGSAQVIAREVNRLLGDPAAMVDLQRRAYAKGRETIWPKFAERAATLIEVSCARAVASAPGIGRPDSGGVFAMSDDTGMFQHSIGIIPDRRHGYCLDDNVRALMWLNTAEGIRPEIRARWSMTYASFIQHAWNEDRASFRNFMRYDRTWAEDEGSQDSNGRALWTLGATIENARDADMRHWATLWYDRALPSLSRFASPRTRAFVMLGAAARLRTQPDHALSAEVLENGAAFLAHLLDTARRPDWAWFEAVLGYDNPRLSQALIEAGQLLARPSWTTAGLQTLDWIARRQTSAAGHFRPIGSGSFGKDGTSLPFDQQPLEAQAAIDAALSAWRATGDARWREHARAAWQWFFGANDRGAVLADLASGRCRDGINPRGVNANCGAESILALHLAHQSMLAIEARASAQVERSRLDRQLQRIEITLAAP